METTETWKTRILQDLHIITVSNRQAILKRTILGIESYWIYSSSIPPRLNLKSNLYPLAGDPCYSSNSTPFYTALNTPNLTPRAEKQSSTQYTDYFTPKSYKSCK